MAQAKEKWRALFEKYKTVCFNNSKTGRDREAFEFYEVMDEFLGCSDKVRPWFVRETAIRNTDDASSSAREESTSSELSESGNTENQQEVSHDEAPRATAAASIKHQKVSVNKGQKRKRGAIDLHVGDHDEESEIIQLLKAQQGAITKSEEKDQKIMEAMLKRLSA